MSLIGHNHPPFETIADLPEDLPKMHFFKNDIQAFRKAIVDKPLDVRGAFFSAILAMYEYMEPIPADDHMAMLRVGIHNTKLWRRVKAELISHGLVQVTPGGRLTNHRFEAEITSYVVEFKNRREAALERERKAKVARATKGDKPATNPLATELQPRSNPVANEFQGGSNSFETAQKPSFDVKKDSNFNGDGTTRRPQPAPQDDHESRIRARVLELERDKEKKEKKEYYTPLTPVGGAVRESGSGPPAEANEDLGFGLFAGPKLLWHALFVVNLDGVISQTLNSGLSRNETVEFCRGIAMQWATELASGKKLKDAVPDRIANFLAAAVRNTGNREKQNQVRLTKAATAPAQRFGGSKGSREGTYKPAFGSFANEAMKPPKAQPDIIIDVTPNDWRKS